MAEEFKVGDRVRINVPNETNVHGKEGPVTLVTGGPWGVSVLIDGKVLAFGPEELERVGNLEPVAEVSAIAASIGQHIGAAQAALKTFHRWQVKTRDNTIGLDVGANAMQIYRSGALLFIIDGRVHIAFAPGYWTEVEYSYEETETKEDS